MDPVDRPPNTHSYGLVDSPQSPICDSHSAGSSEKRCREETSRRPPLGQCHYGSSNIPAYLWEAPNQKCKQNRQEHDIGRCPGSASHREWIQSSSLTKSIFPLCAVPREPPHQSAVPDPQ